MHIKWVYKTKADAQNNFQRLKARLVACMNKHVLGVNYSLTFAAVTDISTVRSFWRWDVPAKHGDIPNAYVKADKEAHLNIYLQLSSGMSFSEERLREHGAANSNKLVLDLRKSLYGLNQTGRMQSRQLHTHLVEVGYQALRKRHVLYWKRDGEDIVVAGVR